MINNWENFKNHMQYRLNEDVNYTAMKMCGYYRANENQLINMTIELLANDINFKWKDYDNKVLEIETFQFEKPYEIILKNGGDKLSFSLDGDYTHDCVFLRSKPMNVPDGAYM